MYQHSLAENQRMQGQIEEMKILVEKKDVEIKYLMKRLFDNNISVKESKLSLLRDNMHRRKDGSTASNPRINASESPDSTKGSPS